MKTKSNLDTIYALSENIVARNIEGELIIVPLAAGVGDSEDELYTLNETGKAIWEKLDGKKNLGQIVKELSLEFTSNPENIAEDVVGITKELLKKKMLVERKK